MSSDKDQSVPVSRKPTKDGVSLPEGQERTAEVPGYVTEELYRFWTSHGSRLVFYGVALLAVVLGTQLWIHSSSSREGSLRETFSTLATNEERVAFAEKHASHPLAAYAWLQAGKEAHEAGDVETALAYFERASKPLAKKELAGWVDLHRAGCLSDLERNDEALALLAKLANDENLAKGIRAEATFKRIVIAKSMDRSELVSTETARLDALDESGFWTERLTTIQYY
jgi:predicted negative regulator of RcsB-dependent stress response